MSLSIIGNLSDDHKLLIEFNDSGNCKLHKKDDSYVCSLIVPWFDPKNPLYIEIKANENQLKERLSPPLGFTKEEFGKMSA